MPLLVTFSSNYADEFDINGWRIFESDKKFKKFLDAFKKYISKNEGLEYHFGTNQSINFDTFKEFSDAFSTQEISIAESKVLEKFFGDSDGIFIDEEYFIE